MKSKKILKPPALKPGDRVGLVCPASRPESPAVLQSCVRLVEEMGFVPIVGKHTLSTYGGTAGTTAQRLEDLQGFVHDDAIAGIFCVTGGFGSLHLLAELDYDHLASNPKVIVGCDDNTSLLLAINACTGLVTFHGPNLDQLESRFSFEHFKNAISGQLAAVTCSDTIVETLAPGFVYAPVEGVVSGRLVGGNLTALMSLLGTPYEPDFKDSLLFLEDFDERNDTLDRWFTTLYVAGHLNATRALAFGHFEKCDTRGSFNMLSIEDLFGDRLKSMAKPCCFRLPIGQSRESATIPIGIEAELNTRKGSLCFLDKPLS